MMTTNFPSGLDSFTNPTATDAMDSVTVPHADQHADVNDAVEALQAKVGVDGSAVTSSLDYQVANQGLTLVKTQTIGSGVSSVTVQNAFDSRFDNYLVSWAGITVAAATAFNISLAIGQTQVPNGWYGNTFYATTGSANALTNYGYSNSNKSETCSARNGELNSGSANIYSPYLASYTRQNFISTDSLYYRMGAAIHQSATSYNSLVFDSGATTMTGGTIRVYGLNNG